MREFYEYIINHCYTASVLENFEKEVNLTLLKVVLKSNPTKDDFEKIVMKYFPKWVDGKEHSYIEIGVELGCQEMALMTIGLGHLVGFWQALSPDTIGLPIDDETKLRMAGMGLVTLKC